MAKDRDIFDRIMALPGLRRFYGAYEKHKAVLLYLLFGGLTTLVSIGTFWLFDDLAGVHTLVANVLSWICAVLFAYVTNRVWVFSSHAAAVGKEMLAFFSGRLLTLGVEELVLLVFVTWLELPGIWVKTAAQVLVLVLNFVISKFFVFKKPSA